MKTEAKVKRPVFVRKSPNRRRRLRVALVGGPGLCRFCLYTFLRDVLRSADIIEIGDQESSSDCMAHISKTDIVLLSLIANGDIDLKPLDDLARMASGIPIAVHTNTDDPRVLEAIIERKIAGIIPTSLSPHVAAAALEFIAAGGTYFPPANYKLSGIPGCALPPPQGKPCLNFPYSKEAITCPAANVVIFTSKANFRFFRNSAYCIICKFNNFIISPNGLQVSL